MQALFWKEWRENRFKIFAGVAFCLILHISRNYEKINQECIWNFQAYALYFGIISAIYMGMDALATERGKGTLDFLLIMPISRIKLLIPKFLIGSAGLLLILASFWASFYLNPPEPTPSDRVYFVAAHLKTILEEVGYTKMLFAWFGLFWFVYGLTFLWSALVDNPVTAAVGGLFSFLLLGSM